MLVEWNLNSDYFEGQSPQPGWAADTTKTTAVFLQCFLTYFPSEYWNTLHDRWTSSVWVWISVRVVFICLLFLHACVVLYDSVLSISFVSFLNYIIADVKYCLRKVLNKYVWMSICFLLKIDNIILSLSMYKLVHNIKTLILVKDCQWCHKHW